MEKSDSEEYKDNFAELLEQSFTETKRMKTGQLIETEIVSISGDTIFLQLNGKSEGLLEREELTDKDGNLTVETGDKIKVFFLSEKNGEMYFTTKISGEKAGKELLESAFENNIPVEGLVEKEIKGGFNIKVGESRAFCPYSQMGQKRVEDAQQWLGKTLTFKITEYRENGRNILVSNRAILEEKHENQVTVLKKTLHEKMIVNGKVTQIRDFGAFVDIEGMQALLPISEISRERVEDVSAVLKEGQEIEASIIKIDWKTEKISLSMKSLTVDPWDSVDTKYKKGSKYKGTVVRITNFGAFVSLEPGLDGLIHISELRTDYRDAIPSDKLKPGQSITVLINNIDKENRRLSLKPSSTIQEDESVQKYMETEDDTYNPFAALLKNKKK
ncbi:MAG: S1 RNA-binding domain-containing protein [Spirochaetales bacterium]|nr:S1 RNA-binding domain-containing protein [Spirochaetales bacterium]